MEVPIRCKYDKLVSVKLLKPNPKNRNKHPSEQIDRLAKLIKYQGVRAPIVISNQSGFIAKGHGTLMAEVQLGMKEVPVVYQDFENEDQEYAFVQSDNAIAAWADLDLSGINFDLQDLGPDLDLDLLGIKNFSLDFISEELEDKAEKDKAQEFKVEVLCVNGEEMTNLVNELTERGMIAKAIFRG